MPIANEHGGFQEGQVARARMKGEELNSSSGALLYCCRAVIKPWLWYITYLDRGFGSHRLSICLFRACALEDIMNSYDSVFLETSLEARGEMPRNWLKVGGMQRTRKPNFC